MAQVSSVALTAKDVPYDKQRLFLQKSTLLQVKCHSAVVYNPAQPLKRQLARSAREVLCGLRCDHWRTLPGAIEDSNRAKTARIFNS